MEGRMRMPTQTLTFSSSRNQRPRSFCFRNRHANAIKLKINYRDIVLISAPNIDCGNLLKPHSRRGSNEYCPKSMFNSCNKSNVYPRPYNIKVRIKEGLNYMEVQA